MIESKEEGIDILNMLVRDGKITHVKNEHEFKDEYLFYVFSWYRERCKKIDIYVSVTERIFWYGSVEHTILDIYCL